jgi:hypothetical protein
MTLSQQHLLFTARPSCCCCRCSCCCRRRRRCCCCAAAAAVLRRCSRAPRWKGMAGNPLLSSQRDGVSRHAQRQSGSGSTDGSTDGSSSATAAGHFAAIITGMRFEGSKSKLGDARFSLEPAVYPDRGEQQTRAAAAHHPNCYDSGPVKAEGNAPHVDRVGLVNAALELIRDGLE